MPIKFTVFGRPYPMPRPRAMSMGGKARMYQPKNDNAAYWKANVCLVASSVMGGDEMLTGPLSVDLLFVMPRPKNITRKRTPNPRRWHTIKPDRDNLDKCVLDALSGIVWKDDSQVCDGRIRKVIASGDEPPCVVVTITALPEYPDPTGILGTVAPKSE